MDLEKSKVLLKKITTLHESATAYSNDISSLERDLLLQYTREFYETIHNSASILTSDVTRQATHVKPGVLSEKKDAEPPKQENVHISAPPVAIAASQHVDSKKETIVEESISNSEVIKEKKQELVASVTEGDFQELFEDPNISDVSSKFSQAPIADIGRALGLNDRILMINTLFGGNQQRFNDVVSELNDSPSFAAAKSTLINGVAKEFEWNNPKVLIQAKRFVNIVRRRHQ